MNDLEKLELKYRNKMENKDYITLYFISITLYIIEEIKEIKKLDIEELLIGFWCENIYNDFENYINSSNENKDFNLEILETNLKKLNEICKTYNIKLEKLENILKGIKNV